MGLRASRSNSSGEEAEAVENPDVLEDYVSVEDFLSENSSSVEDEDEDGDDEDGFISPRCLYSNLDEWRCKPDEFDETETSSVVPALSEDGSDNNGGLSNQELLGQDLMESLVESMGKLNCLQSSKHGESRDCADNVEVARNCTNRNANGDYIGPFNNDSPQINDTLWHDWLLFEQDKSLKTNPLVANESNSDEHLTQNKASDVQDCGDHQSSGIESQMSSEHENNKENLLSQLSSKKASRKRPSMTYVNDDSFLSSRDSDNNSSVDEHSYSKKRSRMPSGFSKLTLLSTFGNPNIFWLEVDKEEPPCKRRKMDIINISSDSNVSLSSLQSDGHSLPVKLKSLGFNSMESSESAFSDTSETSNQSLEERQPPISPQKRIQNNQRLYNYVPPTQELQTGTSDNEFILERDSEGKVLVKVNQALANHLKSHQREGVKFMFDTTIVSVKKLVDGSLGQGCILAHSMGLGKTFQVFAFVYTMLNNKHIRSAMKRFLIIVPCNVARNWVDEIKKWTQALFLSEPSIFELFSAKPNKRVEMCEEWYRYGGILIVTNSIYHILVLGKKLAKEGKSKEHQRIQRCLSDPGPDLVVIDESHLLKNDKTLIHDALSRIKTGRRIMLTGTPLQNNLIEYYTMVNFVRPNLLGSKESFRFRFEIPIADGQAQDSTHYEVGVMKKRVHVLYNLVKDSVHRCDYSVLVPYLPAKHEFVLELTLSPVQVNLYRHYLNAYVDREDLKKNLFRNYTMLGYIWNHPCLLVKHYEKRIEQELLSQANENSFFDFDKSGNLDGDPKISSNKKEVAALDKDRPVAPLITWHEQYLPEDVKRVELSSKYVLLFSILEKCEEIGDKLLVFSQSLNNLDLMEELLALKMKEMKSSQNEAKYRRCLNKGITHRWIKNRDYFRLDGKVSLKDRVPAINAINDVNNHRARLMLISTRAGGLGINLVGANRCIIFDASWNPSNDLQAIFRVFRYGQLKPVYIYRFTAYGTMENKIYRRQIVKQSLAHRVVDEHQIVRHYKKNDLEELYQFEVPEEQDRKTLNVPKNDLLLANMIAENGGLIFSYHEQDSLLENRPDEDLSDEERQVAWEEYKNLMKSHAGTQNSSKSTVAKNVKREGMSNAATLASSSLPAPASLLAPVLASPTLAPEPFFIELDD